MMHQKNKCRLGTINTIRYYFDLCAVNLISIVSVLCLLVAVTITLHKNVRQTVRMIDGQSDNYLGSLAAVYCLVISLYSSGYVYVPNWSCENVEENP